MAGKAPSNIGPASRERLSGGPKDMPDRGGAKRPPTSQVTSERVALGKREYPVAQSGVRAGMGRVQVTSERCKLGRSDNNPYDQFNRTMTPVPGVGKGRK